jgi:hypothetical protein
MAQGAQGALPWLWPNDDASRLAVFGVLDTLRNKGESPKGQGRVSQLWRVVLGYAKGRLVLLKSLPSERLPKTLARHG